MITGVGVVGVTSKLAQIGLAGVTSLIIPYVKFQWAGGPGQVLPNYEEWRHITKQLAIQDAMADTENLENKVKVGQRSKKIKNWLNFLKKESIFLTFF